MKIEINGKALLAALALSGSVVFANYVSLVDAKSAGGIIVEEEQTPVGSIQLWSTATPPDGWIEMNGQSTASYPELAKIVGANVPDLRGEFVRGWDGSRGVDAGRALKSTQTEMVNPSTLTFKGDQLPPHSHNYAAYSVGGSGGPIQWGGDANRNSYTSTTQSASAGTPTGKIEGSGTETRPRNVALMYIIKAK